jgi:hypothetical protein
LKLGFGLSNPHRFYEKFSGARQKTNVFQGNKNQALRHQNSIRRENYEGGHRGRRILEIDLGKVVMDSRISRNPALFFGLFAASAFNRALPGAILLYLVPILIAAGIFSGLMGFFTTRAWVGLVLNLLLAAIGCLLFLHIFSYCCAPPNLN